MNVSSAMPTRFVDPGSERGKGEGTMENVMPKKMSSQGHWLQYSTHYLEEAGTHGHLSASNVGTKLLAYSTKRQITHLDVHMCVF